MNYKSSITIIPIMLVIAITFTNCQEEEIKVNEKEISDKIISMERTALNRWGKGDPWGYLDIFADDVTYYNPFENSRIDGLDAMQKYYGEQAGQIFIDKYEMTNIKVQLYGDIAILSYNLFNFKKQSDGSLKESTRWNSTKVYRLINSDWKIIHNHWSFLQPELK
ncbi:MAG: nuclear transport factor 2 family protein [Bacteroidota bacterium]